MNLEDIVAPVLLATNWPLTEDHARMWTSAHRRQLRIPAGDQTVSVTTQEVDTNARMFRVLQTMSLKVDVSIDAG